MRFDVIVKCECGHKYLIDTIIATDAAEAERFAMSQRMHHEAISAQAVEPND